MPVSYKTQGFHDIRQRLEADDVTSDNVDEVIKSFGEKPEEYKAEWETYTSGLRDGSITYGEAEGFAPTAVIGSALGKTAEGLGDFADAILPETITTAVKNVGESIGEYIPEEAQRFIEESFDPYHGEGMEGTVRDTVATIGSYLVPYTGALKIANLGIKGANAASKLAGLGAIPRMGKLGKYGKWTGAGAAAVTAVEDPRENVYDMVVEEFFPEHVKKKFESEDFNPDDPEAQEYLDAFMKNLLTEGLFIGSFAGLGKIAKTIKTSDVVSRLRGRRAEKATALDRAGRFFTANKGTDDEMLALTIKREAAANAALSRIRGFNEPLKQKLKKAGKYNDGYLEEVVDKALKGAAGAKARLLEDVPEAAEDINKMRKALDDLSLEVIDTLAKDGSKLALKIDKNIGTYINRSYRKYDDKKFDWVKDVDQGVKDRAIAYLERQEGINQSDIPALLKQLAEGKEKSVNQVFDLFSRYQKASSSNPLKNKKELPKEIRDLWGEVKNPFINFQNTFEKLSLFKAENEYLEGVAQHLTKNNLARRTERGLRPEGLVGLDEVVEGRLGGIARTGPDKKFKNPLEGLYVNKNYRDMVKEGTDDEGFFGANPNGIVRTWLKGKSASQIAKTVLNPGTHARNTMGNVVIMGANGMMMGPKGMKEGWNTIRSKFMNVNNKALTDNVARYQELGIIDTGVNANIIRKVAKDAYGKNPNGLMEQIYKKSGGEALFKAYQAEDDIFKVMHFEKSRNYLKKAYPDIPADELDKLAAQRTRDLMPNYNLVPKALKRLRGAPVGDFLAFPAEMTRVTKNLFKYTLQDMASGNKALQAQAFKRLGGMTVAGVAGDAGAHYTAELFGINDEQQKAINELGPTWGRNTAKIYTSEIKKSPNGNVIVDFVDLGPMDPFEYLKVGSRTLHGAMDKFLVEGKEFTEDDGLRLALQLSDQMLGPYFGSSMITNTFLDLAGEAQDLEERGTTSELQDFGKKFVDSSAKLFAPGFLTFLSRRKDFENAKRKQLGEEGDPIAWYEFHEYFPGLGREPTGREVAKYGYSMPGNYAGLEEFAGLKTTRLDLTSGIRRNILPLIADINASRSAINQRLGSYEFQNPQQVYEAYIKSNEQKLSKFRQLRELLHNYENFFGDMYTSQMHKGMTENGRRPVNTAAFRTMNSALDNQFIPNDISETYLQLRFETGAPLPLDAISNLHRELQNSPIESIEPTIETTTETVENAEGEQTSFSEVNTIITPFLKDNEGFLSKATPAVENPNSRDIGYGHKLTGKELAQQKVFGIDISNGITEEQASFILEQDLQKRFADLPNKIPNFNSYSPREQALILDYEFNVKGGAKKFKNLLKAIENQDPYLLEKEYRRYFKKGGKTLELSKRNDDTYSNFIRPLMSEYGVA